MERAVHFTCIFTLAAILSVVSGEKCAYVRGPLAATKDTVVFKLDCNQSTTSSYNVPLQLRDNATHVALQLVRCHTVPVGLFTNVTDNLTSVTVASEDAVQLLEGTFLGLGHVTELRLLGFTRLQNVSRSMLEPLRRIQTLILDGFWSDNFDLPYLGSVVRKLSGTPIRRLVINSVKGRLFSKPIMHVDDFKISNASVKERVIREVQFNYRGSIRRAFPELTCFCGAGLLDQQNMAETSPALYDLFLISEHLKEIVLYRPKYVPAFKSLNNFSIPFQHFIASLVTTAVRLYPDLVHYVRDRLNGSIAEDCALRVILKIGANLSKFTVNNMQLNILKAAKPICVEESDNLMHIDITGSHVPGTMPEFTGFKKLQYFSLENTGIRKLSKTFLQHFPTLNVLKLSKLDIGDFLKNTDKDFFGSCPTLSDIYLDKRNIPNEHSYDNVFTVSQPSTFGHVK